VLVLAMTWRARQLRILRVMGADYRFARRRRAIAPVEPPRRRADLDKMTWRSIPPATTAC